MFTVICLIDIFSYEFLSKQGPLHFVYFMTITLFCYGYISNGEDPFCRSEGLKKKNLKCFTLY